MSTVSKGQVYRKGSKFIRINSGGAKPTGFVRNGATGRFPVTAEPVVLAGYKLLETAPAKPAAKATKKKASKKGK
jgi:hypothetical protein